MKEWKRMETTILAYVGIILLFCIMPVYTFALHVNSHRIVLKPTVLKGLARSYAHGLTDNCHYQSCVRFW